MANVVRFRNHRFDMKTITVEPVMFLYMFANFTMFLTLQAFIYDKVCYLNFNETVCSNLNNKTFKKEEDFVQKTTSHWVLYANLSMGVPALLSVIMFVGPWGDRVGRKIPIMLSLFGSVMSTISAILNSIFMSAPLPYILIGSLLNGTCGGYLAALMSMYAYIAHVSTTANKTVKIGILEAMIFLSATLGTAVSGVMLDHTSYVFVFSLLCGVVTLALVYTLLWVDNVKPETEESSDSSRTWCNDMILSPVKDVAFCVYGKRQDRNFLNLALLMTVMFVLMLVTVGKQYTYLVYAIDV